MFVHESPVLYSVDLHDCEGLAGLSPEEIIVRFATSLERAGATVVQTSSHTFPGAGLTSVLILRESHAVLSYLPTNDVERCAGGICGEVQHLITA